MQTLVEIGPVVLEKKILMSLLYFSLHFYTCPIKKCVVFEQISVPFVQGCFVPICKWLCGTGEDFQKKILDAFLPFCYYM